MVPDKRGSLPRRKNFDGPDIFTCKISFIRRKPLNGSYKRLKVNGLMITPASQISSLLFFKLKDFLYMYINNSQIMAQVHY